MRSASAVCPSDLAVSKLIARPIGHSSTRACSKHPLCAFQIVHAQQDSRLELGRFHIKYALGIFLNEVMEQGFGRGFVPRLVFRSRCQKIRIVGENITRLPRLMQIRGGLGKSTVSQIGVTERQVGCSRCVAGVLSRIVADSLVGGGSAQVGQLLCHGAQFA